MVTPSDQALRDAVVTEHLASGACPCDTRGPRRPRPEFRKLRSWRPGQTILFGIRRPAALSDWLVTDPQQNELAIAM